MAWKLDGPGRDLRRLVNIVHDPTGRGVGLKCPLRARDAAIETTTASGKLVFGNPPRAGTGAKDRQHHPPYPYRQVTPTGNRAGDDER